jgi:hypothetical protein
MNTNLLRKVVPIGCALCVGFACGVASAVAWQRYSYRTVTTLVAGSDLDADHIRIPAGTELIYDKSLPGHHELHLPITMDSLTFNSKLVPMGPKKRSSVLVTYVE